MKNQHEDSIYSALEEITQEARVDLEHISEMDPKTAGLLVSKILDFACKSTNTANITSARRIIKRAPKSWLDAHLTAIAIRALDLSDEWEYRRFLEVLHIIESPLFANFREMGLNSPAAELREIASDAESWKREEWYER